MADRHLVAGERSHTPSAQLSRWLRRDLRRRAVVMGIDPETESVHVRLDYIGMAGHERQIGAIGDSLEQALVRALGALPDEVRRGRGP